MVAPAHAPCSFIRPVWAALVAVAAVAIGACTTLRAYPTLTLQRRLVAAGEQLDEAAIRRLLRAAPTLSAALEIGYAAFARSACTAAAREGITAFGERRRPDFSRTG